MSRTLFLAPLVLSFATACNLVKGGSPSAPTTLQFDAGAPATQAYPSSGPEVVAYVAARYPDRLAEGVSRDERVENMKFLRDRIIEVGKCGGMDLGWNLKRGGPEVSIDFIVDRTGGDLRGVDIAFDYDNPDHPLQLQWIGGDAPFYKEYPVPACN